MCLKNPRSSRNRMVLYEVDKTIRFEVFFKEVDEGIYQCILCGLFWTTDELQEHFKAWHLEAPQWPTKEEKEKYESII